MDRIDELINRIDPDTRHCQCCDTWTSNRLVPFQHIQNFGQNSSDKYHFICKICCDKIKFIFSNRNLIPQEFEELKKYYYTRQQIGTAESISLLCYKTLISCYSTFRDKIEYQKKLNDLKFKQALYSSPNLIIYHNTSDYEIKAI